ncbi:hypothetical protein FO519_008190, partial [Halicephalobus sp. NKZ332]
LASDPKVHKLTGRTLMTADLGEKYGFTDIDGRRISSMRSIKFLLSSGVLKVPCGPFIARFIPRCFKIPGWMMSAYVSRL